MRFGFTNLCASLVALWDAGKEIINGQELTACGVSVGKPQCNVQSSSTLQGLILPGNGAALAEPGQEPLFPIADKKQYKTMLLPDLLFLTPAAPAAPAC